MNGLVLSGGGARAAYQAGVLLYITERVPDLTFPILTGVSAGAINAAFLAGHRGSTQEATKDLAEAWTNLTVERVFETGPTAMGVTGFKWIWALGSGGGRFTPEVQGLVDTAPLWEYLESHFDVDGVGENLRSGRLRALGLTATCYATAQAITFVHAQEDVPMWERSRRRGIRSRIEVEHVMASCAIPLVFPAIEVDGEYYGDGSIRQAAPLSPAIHLGADRLLTIATRYPESPEEASEPVVDGYPPPAQIIGTLMGSIFLDALEADLERLERVNRLLDTCPTDRVPDNLRKIDYLVIEPSVDLGRLAVEFWSRLPRSVRFALKGLGTHRTRSADLLSYLAFEPPFVGRIIDLGYEDARNEWSRIESFLAVGVEQ